MSFSVATMTPLCRFTTVGMKRQLSPSNMGCVSQRRTFLTLNLLTTEHRAVRKAARMFAETKLMKIAAEIDRQQDIPNEIFTQLGEMGFLGMCIPTEWGGAELDTLSYVLAVEEISRACASTSVMMTINNNLYCEPVMGYATDAQKRDFLSPFASGQYLGCFALSEPGNGSDAGAASTTAKLNGDHWILNGTKAWVANAHDASAAIVFATTDRSLKHNGITAFLVPTDSRGLFFGKKDDLFGVRGSNTSQIIMEDCIVPRGNILGKIGQGFKIAMTALDGGRIGIAAQALGIAQASLDIAAKYALERKAFGIAISKLYAIQRKISLMSCRIESSRLLTWKAAVAKDNGEEYTRAAAMAKLCASETSVFCAHQAMQILGAMGYVSDMPVDRYYRDARVTEIYEGTSEVQHLVIANSVLNEYSRSVVAFPKPAQRNPVQKQKQKH